ncbi:hypothetical protein M0O54_20235, partial [Acinetobacter lactucae]
LMMLCHLPKENIDKDSNEMDETLESIDDHPTMNNRKSSDGNRQLWPVPFNVFFSRLRKMSNFWSRF